MDLSQVHVGVHKLRRKKRVGRGIGSGHGKTSTRGHKGQWASAGAKKPAVMFEGGQMQLFRRIPKRGFSHATWDKKYHVVNVGDLERFNDGDTVDAEALRKTGLAKGPADGVRILGTGELTKKLTVRAHHFSKSAQEKIAARGGTAEVIPPPKKPKRNKMKPRTAPLAKESFMNKQNPYLIGAAAVGVLYLLLVLMMSWQQALVVTILAVVVAFLMYRGKIKAIFTIPELRQKILLTLLFLAIYRIGFAIPLPFVDQTKMTAAMGAGGALGNVLNFVSMFSGGNLSHATVFGLGIMPYISASIIFQLLGAVYPPLEKLQKEGESGRKKINEYTRYATVLICLFQAFMYVQYIMGDPRQGKQGWGLDAYNTIPCWVTMIVTLTCGTIFLMWLGEQIDEYGIGNGISLIIMAGIVARIPAATSTLFFENGHFKESVFTLGGGGGGRDMSFEKLVVLIVLFVTVVVGVVAITKAQRRIKTQSAKHVRGRRVFGGTSQWLPLRVNQAGVMPVIFASSLLVLPYFLFGALANGTDWRWAKVLQETFERQGYWYTLMFIALIYVFCYFWTAIIFNPKDMANNLKDYGSFIPGYRPGKRTAEYLERVMIRITYVGAAFLAVIAVIPTLITNTMNVDPNVASFYGGTGLLIVISVALDLVQKINSHLVMRNYPGLTED